MDFELELRKITEAFCVSNNLPIRRRFTDAELEESIARIRDALERQQPLELADLSPHAHVAEYPEPSEHFDKRWDEDQYLDDPRHGQAAGINRDNRGRGRP